MRFLPNIGLTYTRVLQINKLPKHLLLQRCSHSLTNQLLLEPLAYQHHNATEMNSQDILSAFNLILELIKHGQRDVDSSPSCTGK